MPNSTSLKNTEQALAPLNDSRVGPFTLTTDPKNLLEMGLTDEVRKGAKAVYIHISASFYYRMDGEPADATDIVFEKGNYLMSKADSKLASLRSVTGNVTVIMYPVNFEE